VGQGRWPGHVRMRTFLLGVLLAGPDDVSRVDQCQRYFIIYLHKFCYTDSISYDLYNFVGQLRVG
jgi:hypothetical protein